MKTIHAIYEHGVFRPLEAVELAEQTRVEFEPKIVGHEEVRPGNTQGIYDLLSARFRSGEHDVAARQNEHQP